jgi:hypothetical protein
MPQTEAPTVSVNLSKLLGGYLANGFFALCLKKGMTLDCLFLSFFLSSGLELRGIAQK